MGQEPAPRHAATFSVAGSVLVRVEEADPRDLATIARQLGPPRPRSDGDADIVIRFRSRIERHGGLRLIGVHDAGFTDDAFLLLRGRQKTPAIVELAFEPSSQPIEIHCEHGLRSVPLLVPLVNLAALRRGIVPVHGSLVAHEGRGILIVGWSKGGKTETVLAFMDAGASFVGDEWVYVHPDGTGTGIPEPTRVWDWQLAQFPAVRRRIDGRTRARLRATRVLADTLARASAGRLLGPTALGGLARRGEPIIRAQTSVQRFPAQLYGAERLSSSSRIDAVVMAISRADDGLAVEVEPMARLIDRIVVSNEHERSDLRAAIEKYRFAFPEAPVLDPGTLPELERRLLRAALMDRPGWRLEHPYPPVIRSLYELVHPLLERPPTS